VAWIDSEAGEVSFARVSEGAVVGAPVSIASAPGGAYGLSLSWIDNSYLLAWIPVEGAEPSVELSRVEADGTAGGELSLPTIGPVSSSALGWNGTEAVLAWSSRGFGEEEIYAAAITSALELVGEPLQVTHSRTAARGPALAPIPSGVVMAWADERHGNLEIYNILIGCLDP
jgi:hypothetical protein